MNLRQDARQILDGRNTLRAPSAKALVEGVDDAVFEVTGGCICCTVSGDFQPALGSNAPLLRADELMLVLLMQILMNCILKTWF